MEEVARIVLALETPDVAEEVMHFLDRTGRARVVGTAVDAAQLAEAVRQLEPDAVVAAPSLVPSRGSLNGSTLLAVDTSQSVGALRRAIRGGATGFFLWPAEREELALAAARVGSKPDEPSGERAPVLAVYAARGGAGATFVATHLAAAFAKRDRRCLLVDLDVVFADASAAIGVPADEEPRTIADLVPLGDEVASQHVDELAWPHPAGFAALLAPASRATVPEHRGPDVPRRDLGGAAIVRRRRPARPARARRDRAGRARGRGPRARRARARRALVPGRQACDRGRGAGGALLVRREPSRHDPRSRPATSNASSGSRRSP